MTWAPAVLPVLSMTERSGSLGFNLIWRPPGFDGPGTVLLQLTRPFNS